MPQSRTSLAKEHPASSRGVARFAAIDVGSNSLHMIISQVDADGGTTALWRMKEMVGLGRTSFPSHHLSQEAMDRAIHMLGRFQSIAQRRGCEKVVAVATSAVREAENGGDFIERARGELGLIIRVVSAKDEARLIYYGVRHAVDLGAEPNLIIDIGGGSVEFIVGNAREHTLLESRKLGSARMTAMFIRSDPAKRSQIDALLKHCDDELHAVLDQIRGEEPVRAIGTSGTMENLAAMCGGRANAQGTRRIELKTLSELTDKLRKSTAAQRVKISGLDEKRQDQILAGALVVQFVMQRLGLRQIALCRSALREGILLEYIGRHLPDLAIRREVPDPRRRSVLDLARKCEWHEQHSQQVARITLRLFDDLATLHKLGRKPRELLEYAALLHDIGWHISSDAHHKHSMYLVQHGGLKGFSKSEIEVIANITRYHRKSIPKPTHDGYTALSATDRRIVDVGGSLLRLADGLDRSHCRVISNLHCKIGKREVQVLLRGRADMELELWAARRKTDMFQSTFGRDIAFIQEGLARA